MTDLIWTRAVADWEDDRGHLEAHIPKGSRLVRIPCIVTEGLTAPPLATPTPEHVVFTSQGAVAYAFLTPTVPDAVRRAKTVWTFGKQTASRLVALGIKVRIVDEASTAEALANHLVKSLPKGATVLVPAPQTPAYDLAGRLENAGFSVTRLTCYKTVPMASDLEGAPLGSEAVRDLSKDWQGGSVIAFASPSAVQGFAEAFLSDRGRAARLQDALIALAIGPTTAVAAAQHFSMVVTAKEASAKGLAIAAIQGLSASLQST